MSSCDGNEEGRHLSAKSPDLLTRTWADVMEHYSMSGVETTRHRKWVAFRSRPFATLRNITLMDTEAGHLLAVLELIFGARLNYTNSPEFKAQDDAAMKKAFLAFSRAGMEAYFKALTDKPYVVDKSRGWGVHFDLLSLIFDEEPKIVCLVRDLRQILASMEKKFRQNPDKHRPIENHNNLSGITTFKRAVMHLQTPPVGLALDRLIEIHQRGWDKKILFIRYEDLAAQPKQTLQKVYSYLGVPDFQHNFNEVAQVTQEDDQAYGIPGLHAIRPKVEPRTNDYLSVLGPDAVRFVQSNFAWYFSLFGYHTNSV